MQKYNVIFHDTNGYPFIPLYFHIRMQVAI